MSRLERVEREISHSSYTIKEEKDQNLEKKIKDESELCRRNRFQEDKKPSIVMNKIQEDKNKKPSVMECLKWKDDEVQEDFVQKKVIQLDHKVPSKVLVTPAETEIPIINIRPLA